MRSLIALLATSSVSPTVKSRLFVMVPGEALSSLVKGCRFYVAFMEQTCK